MSGGRKRRRLPFAGVRRRLQRLRLQKGGAPSPILVRQSRTSPEASLVLRALLVALLLAGVFVVFLLDRSGLTDNVDGQVSVSDLLYFTMITVTTVGYGDIVPVSDTARLLDAFIVTPVRIFIWFIFLGTAYQLIFQRLIEEWRMTRLQRDLDGHTIICGFGHSGSVAAQELLTRGWNPDDVVVIDRDHAAVQRAAERGFIGMHGDCASEELLRVAAVDRARAVIVSVGRDDTTVLVLLTIRGVSKNVRLLASVREQENFKLARASGADVVVSPSKFGGFLLADAVTSRGTVEFISEVLSFHGGFQLVEREPRPGELGKLARDLEGSLLVQIRRGDRRLGSWDDKALRIEPGDRLLVIDSDAVVASAR